MFFLAIFWKLFAVIKRLGRISSVFPRPTNESELPISTGLEKNRRSSGGVWRISLRKQKPTNYWGMAGSINITTPIVKGRFPELNRLSERCPAIKILFLVILMYWKISTGYK
jgi:hypothetical protein